MERAALFGSNVGHLPGLPSELRIPRSLPTRGRVQSLIRLMLPSMGCCCSGAMSLIAARRRTTNTVSALSDRT
jgi:hypothetical protein